MAQFADDLNVSIANALNLQTYIDLEDSCKGCGHYSHDCANMRLLLIKEDDEYTFDSNQIDLDMPKLINDVDDGGEFYAEEELVEPINNVHCLVVRHTFNNQLRDNHDLQRTIIFHSRYLIKGKLCSLIIDSRGCANIGKKYILAPLNSKDVHNDQIKMIMFCKEVMGNEEESCIKDREKRGLE
ncbi:hypothetical protein J1N35_044091 [Gossypium stocksii]|uniref:Uncharacterized protein n=1 Tax=Gossypium stocksii TaxID=47602 RepID=A0A9D3U8L3_9ROSI|nr:hypothetical protein J1N35_044091 [Gossypium stocksii]